MPAERAGYTVTMFLVDTSPSMGTLRTVELPPGPNGEYRSTEMTNLQWALQFVKLKIQEMIFNGRKTDQCGVIVFGSEETDNIINDQNGGYDNVKEFIPIAQPGSGTLTKLDTLEPSTVTGDPIDALIVGIETQAAYLANKKTWTRKIMIITDGENPIEVEDWEATVRKMDALDIGLTIVGVDFDDPDFPFEEPNKTVIKKANEEFYETLTSHLKQGMMGTCALALRETTKPDIKQTRSTLMGTILRLGDTETKPEEALEILVKTSKCTSVTRPKGWKKFSVRVNEADEMEVDKVGEDDKTAYVQLQMRTEYYVDRTEHDEDSDSDIKMEDPDENLLDSTNAELKDAEAKKDEQLEKVEKEDLIRGFKYGTTYAPCPDGQFPKLPTKKGIDICGFFSIKNFRRELSMGEIQYVWADPTSPQQQVALSSIVQAMYEKNVMAIARWVSKDGMDPKMGVLYPSVFDKVECLLWAQMPFADDVRKYTFTSLDHLVSKKGEVIQQHPYLPTDSQLKAMENFVDAMDLMAAGDKDEEGNRGPWFETLQSYNPTLHRIKQALFHAAVVSDITTNPLPPPHPELVKYFEPPRKVLKRAREAIEECKAALKVKEVPKRVAKARKDGHAHAQEEDENLLLLDRKAGQTPTHSPVKGKAKAKLQDSDTEDDEEEDLILLQKGKLSTPVLENRRVNGPLPTPARSISPEIDPGRAPGRIIGTTYPLKDFQKNIAQGDVVSKAVEDLGVAIEDIVMRPFAKRRNVELIECMKVLRDTCLKEDEIDAWNTFLEELKDKCLDKPGNPDFWSEVRKVGRNMSLISKEEARKQGGTSTISEQDAIHFLVGHS